jgi:hypothetical protein
LPPVVDLSTSRGLVVFDRHTGQKLWQTEARHGFVHNGIVAGGDRVYCLDKLPKSLSDKLRRRGKSAPTDFRVLAFDAPTGGVLWETRTNVFGSWLSYSEKHDVLLQAGASATDRLKDEADKGMIAYRGASGRPLWSQLELKYTGPCILHNELIFTTPASYKTNSGTFGLLDGKPRLATNPLTGQDEPWRIYRTYGCNYPVACENLLTFRSGAAGFYDLENRAGTGNLGGFKSGCSANLIAADGVLNAPDYTRTCSCPYQNQTSLALIHWPELELWTHNQFGAEARDGARVKRVGINFGAPGDRLAETGTLWLDHPSVGGSSPNVIVTVAGAGTNYFRHHSSQVSGDGPAWVFASGVRDARTIVIAPETRKQGAPPPAPKKKAEDEDADEKEENNHATNGVATASTNAPKTNKVEAPYISKLTRAPYRVRLFFAEPDNLLPGDRVFSVSLQGRRVLTDFDVMAETGARLRGVVKEFPGVMVGGELTIDLTRAKSKQHGSVLCGVEMILEERTSAR